MPTCEMCGKEEEMLAKVKIEGSVLELCKGCARFGEVITRPEIRVKDFSHRRPVQMPKRREVLQVIKPDYAQKIRNTREKMGLTQEEFAKRLNEKWSIMQKIEAGQFKPSIDLARKLERMLKVDIIDEYSEKGEIPLTTPTKKSEGFTMADFVKTKKQK